MAKRFSVRLSKLAKLKIAGSARRFRAASPQRGSWKSQRRGRAASPVMIGAD